MNRKINIIFHELAHWTREFLAVKPINR